MRSTCSRRRSSRRWAPADRRTNPVTPTEQIGACRTLDGDPIDPYDAVAAALVGRVRRVVLGSDGTVINLGRRTRLFRGSARHAVWLSHGRHCVYPGCEARHCDIDHLRSWNADGGDTDVGNGAPLCGHHDRWKHDQRDRIWRDMHGTWHAARSDGSELTPAI